MSEREPGKAEGMLQGRISQLRQGYGFVMYDGKSMFFHKSSLIEMNFNGLMIGQKVYFNHEQEEGKPGPRVTTMACSTEWFD